jgi:hypothetical protein
MSIAPSWTQCLAFFGTPLVIEPSPGQLSGDAGLLLIRPFDLAWGSAELAPTPSTTPRPRLHQALLHADGPRPRR